MLVFSRKAGESFLIDGGIEVVVLETGSEKVKIGIHAPQSIRVIRKELVETEKLNRESSASARGVDFGKLDRALTEKNRCGR